jgi:hypothetical protein
LRWIFYSSGGCESVCPERVARSGGANSMLRFKLERRGDEMNRCQKMKRMQRIFLDSMERKRGTA